MHLPEQPESPRAQAERDMKRAAQLEDPSQFKPTRRIQPPSFVVDEPLPHVKFTREEYAQGFSMVTGRDKESGTIVYRRAFDPDRESEMRVL